MSGKKRTRAGLSVCRSLIRAAEAIVLPRLLVPKTDLKIRPIYHRNKNTIESHICIAFVAYTIYKETERRLAQKKVSLSPARVAELTKTMYTIKIKIPETDQWEVIPFAHPAGYTLCLQAPINRQQKGVP